MTIDAPRRRLVDRLDAGVQWTGIPDLAAGRPRRRPLRWPATIALTLAFGGFAAMLVGAPTLIGYTAVIAGYGLAGFMPFWGPLKPWGGAERVDEYDRAVRARAFVAGFAALAATAIGGIFLIVALSLVGAWGLDALRQALVALGFLLLAVCSAGPTCYASWTSVPLDED